MRVRSKKTFEAVQWLGFEQGPHDLNIMPWSPDSPQTGALCLEEDDYRIEPGDWIVEGTFVMTDVEFKAKYEAA